MFSIEEKTIKVINLLVQNGADPDVVNEEQNTSLHLACAKATGDFYCSLVEHHHFAIGLQRLPHRRHRKPLTDRLKQEKKELEVRQIHLAKRITLLVRKTKNINAQNKLGETPLHCCIFAKINTLFHLLAYGAKPSIQNINGNNPIDYIDDILKNEVMLMAPSFQKKALEHILQRNKKFLKKWEDAQSPQATLMERAAVKVVQDFTQKELPIPRKIPERVGRILRSFLTGVDEIVQMPS